MAPPPPTGLRRLAAAFGHSLDGLADIWRSEAAFRLEAICLAASLPAAGWLGQTPRHAATLIGSVLLIMIVEVLNSAIEATVDRIGPERHDLSRRAKDLGSLAVLLAVVLAALLWLAALLSHVRA